MPLVVVAEHLVQRKRCVLRLLAGSRNRGNGVERLCLTDVHTEIRTQKCSQCGGRRSVRDETSALRAQWAGGRVRVEERKDGVVELSGGGCSAGLWVGEGVCWWDLARTIMGTTYESF